MEEKRLMFIYEMYANEYSGARASWYNMSQEEHTDPEWFFTLFYDQKNDLWRIGLHAHGRSEASYHDYTIPYLAHAAFEKLVDMMNDRLKMEGWVIE